MRRTFLAILGGLLLVFGAGCSEQPPQPKVQPAADAPQVRTPVPQVLEVVIPENVQGKWKLVKIAVRDQQTGVEDIYSVDIGGSFKLPDSNLKVRVENFLPAFIMDGQRMTSASNKTTNPAVLIIIHENDQEIYRGWLFGLYPDTHAFQHPRYNFTLLGYQPAG